MNSIKRFKKINVTSISSSDLLKLGYRFYNKQKNDKNSFEEKVYELINYEHNLFYSKDYYKIDKVWFDSRYIYYVIAGYIHFGYSKTLESLRIYLLNKLKIDEINKFELRFFLEKYFTLDFVLHEKQKIKLKLIFDLKTKILLNKEISPDFLIYKEIYILYSRFYIENYTYSLFFYYMQCEEIFDNKLKSTFVYKSSNLNDKDFPEVLSKITVDYLISNGIHKSIYINENLDQGKIQFQYFLFDERYKKHIDLQKYHEISCKKKKKSSLIYLNKNISRKINNQNDFILKTVICDRSNNQQLNIIKSAIDKYFKLGYCIKSKKDFESLLFILNNEYKITNVSKETVDSVIKGFNYCLINKDTYIDYKYTINLPNRFTNLILRYINNNIGHTIYYAKLFSLFYYEFSKLNVKNKFYAKGLIDSILTDEFIFMEECFFKEKSSRSSNSLVEVLHKFNKKFNLNDVKQILDNKNFINKKSVLEAEKKNGLIWVSKSEYIYFNNLEMNWNDWSLLNSYVIQTLKYYDEKVLHIEVIFEFIKETHIEFLRKFDIISSYFLRNILIYKNIGDFFIKKSFVALDLSWLLSGNEIITKRMYEFEKINYQNYYDMIHKLGITTYQTFWRFLNESSSTYVQTDFKEVVAKSSLNLTKNQIDYIKINLDNYLDENLVLDTSEFYQYGMFRLENYEMNKYFLVGIVRSYLHKNFNIIKKKKEFRPYNFYITQIL